LNAGSVTWERLRRQAGAHHRERARLPEPRSRRRPDRPHRTTPPEIGSYALAARRCAVLRAASTASPPVAANRCLPRFEVVEHLKELGIERLVCADHDEVVVKHVPHVVDGGRARREPGGCRADLGCCIGWSHATTLPDRRCRAADMARSSVAIGTPRCRLNCLVGWWRRFLSRIGTVGRPWPAGFPHAAELRTLVIPDDLLRRHPPEGL
jgi:hypothetical protein